MPPSVPWFKCWVMAIQLGNVRAVVHVCQHPDSWLEPPKTSLAGKAGDDRNHVIMWSSSFDSLHYLHYDGRNRPWNSNFKLNTHDSPHINLLEITTQLASNYIRIIQCYQSNIWFPILSYKLQLKLNYSRNNLRIVNTSHSSFSSLFLSFYHQASSRRFNNVDYSKIRPKNHS